MVAVPADEKRPSDGATRRERLPSLTSVLVRARTEEEVFRTAGDALAAAELSVTWWFPELPGDRAPSNATRAAPPGGERAWQTPVAHWPEEQALTLRIDVGDTPRVLLVLKGEGLSGADCATGEMLAGQLALACEAVRLIADLSQRNAELATRNRLSEAAANAADFDEFLAAAVDEMKRYLRCDALSLYLTHGSGKFVALAHHVGGTAEAEVRFAQIPLGKGPVGQVAADGQPRCFHPESFAESAQPVISRMGYGTGMAVPLKTQSALLGVLVGAWIERREVSPGEVQLMASIGTRFAAAAHTQRLAEELRRSVAELSRTQERLIQHERLAAVGEMAALIAHVVRNPLAVIYNAISCLRRSSTEDDRKNLMEMIVQEGDRLNQMVDNLLQFAQPSVPQLAPTELRPLLEAALASSLSDQAGAVELRLELEPELPPLPVDERLFRQALMNVIHNALQSLRGGGALSVRARREQGREGALVRIDVEDSGPGIQPELRDRIFEPFFTTRADGAGLGLVLARRILRSHGGELTLSDPTAGHTTFSVHLPVQRSG